MTIEEELKQYIVAKYGTLTKFGEIVGLSQSTLSTIFKRGIRRTSITRIFLICDELGISADALAEGKIIPKEDYGKIDMEVLQAFETLKNQYNLTIDGKPIEKEESWMISNSFLVGIQLVKQRRSMAKNGFEPDFMITDPNRYLQNIEMKKAIMAPKNED